MRMEEVVILKPLFLFEVDEAKDDDEETDKHDDGVGERGLKLRHVFEVHAVPADDEGERHEDSGDDSEDGHDVVLADVKVGLVEIANLDGEVADGLGGVAEIVDLIEEKAEIASVFALKETVFVFFEDLAEVG